MTRQELGRSGRARDADRRATRGHRAALLRRPVSREAAEAMGKQEGTVRGLQFRAIAALRRQLGIEVADEVPAPPGAGGRTR